MNNALQHLIDEMADEAHNLYINDEEGKYEFNEIIEQFGDSIKSMLEQNTDKKCKVIEYDEDYDTALSIIDDILEDLRDCKVCEYYTAEVNDVHFWFVLTKGV